MGALIRDLIGKLNDRRVGVPFSSHALHFCYICVYIFHNFRLSVFVHNFRLSVFGVFILGFLEANIASHHHIVGTIAALVRELFDKLDTNKDGLLTSSDVRRAIRIAHHPLVVTGQATLDQVALSSYFSPQLYLLLLPHFLLRGTFLYWRCACY